MGKKNNSRNKKKIKVKGRRGFHGFFKRISRLSINILNNKAFLTFLVLFLVFVSLTVGINFRLQLSNMEAFEDMAKDIVYRNYYNSEYSNLISGDLYSSLKDSEGQIRIIAKKRANEKIHSEEGKNTISSYSESLKQVYQDDYGTTYLFATDPYFYLGELNKNNTENFMVKTSSIMYNLGKIGDDDFTHLRALYLIPVLFFLVSGVLFFILSFVLLNIFFSKGYSSIGSLFSLFLYSIHPEFVQISFSGVSDTNIVNVFFILLVSLFLVLFFIAIKKLIDRFSVRSITYLAISFLGLVFSSILFKSFWSGYYFIFFIIIFSILISLVGVAKFYIIYRFFRSKLNKFFKKKNLIFWSIIVSLLPLIFIFSLSIEFFKSFFLKILHLFMPMKLMCYMGSAFCNFSSVQYIRELRPMSFSGMLSRIGSWWIFVLVLISIAVLLYLAFRKASFYYGKLEKGENTLFRILISVFFTAYITSFLVVLFYSLYYASIEAIRFFPYLLVPLFLILGAGFSFFVSFIVNKYVVDENNRKDYEFNKNKCKIIYFNSHRTVVYTVLIFLVFCSLSFISLKDNFESVGNKIPKMHDGIIEVAEGINNFDGYKSSKVNINSWWDAGHFFHAYSNHNVLQKAFPDLRISGFLASSMFVSNKNDSLKILYLINNDKVDELYERISKTKIEENLDSFNDALIYSLDYYNLEEIKDMYSKKEIVLVLSDDYVNKLASILNRKIMLEEDLKFNSNRLDSSPIFTSVCNNLKDKFICTDGFNFPKSLILGEEDVQLNQFKHSNVITDIIISKDIASYELNFSVSKALSFKVNNLLFNEDNYDEGFTYIIYEIDEKFDGSKVGGVLIQNKYLDSVFLDLYFLREYDDSFILINESYYDFPGRVAAYLVE